MASLARQLRTTEYYRMEPSRRQRAVAAIGALVSCLLILMKLLPFVPGHFRGYEYLALGLWCLLGLILKTRREARQE